MRPRRRTEWPRGGARSHSSNSSPVASDGAAQEAEPDPNPETRGRIGIAWIVAVAITIPRIATIAVTVGSAIARIGRTPIGIAIARTPVIAVAHIVGTPIVAVPIVR